MKNLNFKEKINKMTSSIVLFLTDIGALPIN